MFHPLCCAAAPWAWHAIPGHQDSSWAHCPCICLIVLRQTNFESSERTSQYDGAECCIHYQVVRQPTFRFKIYAGTIDGNQGKLSNGSSRSNLPNPDSNLSSHVHPITALFSLPSSGTAHGSIVTSSEPNGAAERKSKGAKQSEKPRAR